MLGEQQQHSYEKCTHIFCCNISFCWSWDKFIPFLTFAGVTYGKKVYKVCFKDYCFTLKSCCVLKITRMHYFYFHHIHGCCDRFWEGQIMNDTKPHAKIVKNWFLWQSKKRRSRKKLSHVSCKCWMKAVLIL